MRAWTAILCLIPHTPSIINTSKLERELVREVHLQPGLSALTARLAVRALSKQPLLRWGCPRP